MGAANAAGAPSSIEKQAEIVKQYLDQRIANHTIRAANIANSETPNYRARVPSFQTVLAQTAGGETEPRLEMKVNVSNETPREDGNNVNIEKEMSALSENSLQYLSAVKILTREMAIAAYAVNTGGK